MKIFFWLALVALCVGCYTTYKDVSLQTGAGILRGSWAGNAEQQCDNTVFASAWNADNSRLATAGVRSLRIWDTAMGNEVGQIVVNGYQIENMAFGADGSELFVQRRPDSSPDILLERYSSAGLLQSSLNTGFRSAALSRDLTRIAGLSGKVFRVWDTQTKAVLHEYTLSQLESGYGAGIALNQNGTRAAIVAYGQQQQVLVVDVATGQIITRKTPPQNSYWYFSNFVFRGDALLVSVSQYGGGTSSFDIQQWDLPSGNVTTLLVNASDFVISPDGLYAVSRFPKFRVLDLQTKQEVVSNPREFGVYSPDFKRGLVGFREATTCGQQLLDIVQNTLQTKLVFATTQDQSADLTLTPSYQSQSSYTVTGTLKLGSSNLRVEGVIYSTCVPGGIGETICQRFQAQALPPPQPFLRLFDDTKEIGEIRFYGGLKADRSLEGFLGVADKSYRIALTSK